MIRDFSTVSSSFSEVGTASSSGTGMYEKTFPIKLVQSPTHSPCSSHLPRTKQHCTAQESICEEEKEIYRQLLTIVTGGQSSFLHNGSSHTIVRSHRDLYVCKKQNPKCSVLRVFKGVKSILLWFMALSVVSTCSWFVSAAPASSPAEDCYSSPLQLSLQQEELQRNPVTLPAQGRQPAGAPATSPVQRGLPCIQGSKRGLKTWTPTQADQPVPCFQAELWIKELTSMYDSRARERRRQIEEQEALAARLLRQRLSKEEQRSPDVEVRVRVPLEKEVPLTIVEEEKPLKEKPEFPELTESMEAEVSRALKGGNPHEILSEGFGLSLTRKDLQTLSNLNWLNDEVINFYMNLLVERSKDPSLPSVNTFNTFFYPKLCSNGYYAVRRWTKKMDIFAKDILLVPIHLGMHWCLSVVDFRKKSITYFDSMGGKNEKACQTLFNYLQLESKDKKGKELATSGWTLHSKESKEIPQQMNGSDCGMFTCKYADYVTKDKPITFTQKHMPYFRRRMVWEILNHKLL
uniref:SUMO specific peptidase 1 n=1 Tax=Oryzias sinensis TaxID=183150 RepID=A0A8C8DPL8_9TELE